jgi:hypothetical protein
MMISSRRDGPRLPAMVSRMTRNAHESQTLVLVAMPARAGRWLGSGQVVRCLYQAGYPAAMAATRKETRPFSRGKT